MRFRSGTIHNNILRTLESVTWQADVYQITPGEFYLSPLTYQTNESIKYSWETHCCYSHGEQVNRQLSSYIFAIGLLNGKLTIFKNDIYYRYGNVPSGIHTEDNPDTCSSDGTNRAKFRKLYGLDWQNLGAQRDDILWVGGNWVDDGGAFLANKRQWVSIGTVTDDYLEAMTEYFYWCDVGTHTWPAHLPTVNTYLHIIRPIYGINLLDAIVDDPYHPSLYDFPSGPAMCAFDPYQNDLIAWFSSFSTNYSDRRYIGRFSLPTSFPNTSFKGWLDMYDPNLNEWLYSRNKCQFHIYDPWTNKWWLKKGPIAADPPQRGWHLYTLDEFISKAWESSNWGEVYFDWLSEDIINNSYNDDGEKFSYMICPTEEYIWGVTGYQSDASFDTIITLWSRENSQTPIKHFSVGEYTKYSSTRVRRTVGLLVFRNDIFLVCEPRSGDPGYPSDYASRAISYQVVHHFQFDESTENLEHVEVTQLQNVDSTTAVIPFEAQGGLQLNYMTIYYCATYFYYKTIHL